MNFPNGARPSGDYTRTFDFHHIVSADWPVGGKDWNIPFTAMLDR
jgi:hypothetical protein